MDDWGYLRRVRYGALQCVGLGSVAGAIETIHLATSLKLPLGFGRMLLLGVTDMLLMGFVAGVLGLASGLVVHLAPPDERRNVSGVLAQQLGGCALLLTGLFLWQGALWIWLEGRQPVGAVAMAAMPPGFAGVVYFNARFWFRRAEVGRAPRLGWLAISALGAGAFVLGAAIVYPLRDTGGAFALEGDKSVVVVTVDGLRHDAVGFLGGPATPRLDALAAESLVFADAVTPTPGSRAANATVLLGLHPLRHKVLDDDDVLGRGYRTLFEILEKEGWATGGFVSSRVAAAGSGLEQGFRSFDDDFLSAVAGVSRINLVRHALDVLTLVADRDGRWALNGRPAGETVARFERWLPARAELPFAAWIHLSDPHRAAVTGEDPAAAAARVDEAIGRIRDALDDAGVLDTTLLVVAGTHGELLGAHGGQTNRTLYDEVVRVPLLFRLGGEAPEVPRVDAQVRSMDVAPSVVDWLRLDPLDESEGIVLTAYATGERSATIWCSLVGRDLDGGWLLGMRNNGIKYVRGPDGAEVLHHLPDDPREATDLSAEQAGAVEKARALLTSEAAALEKLLRAR